MSVKNIGTNKWLVVVEAGYDPSTGERRQRKATVHGAKKDAIGRETELKIECGKTSQVGRTITVAQFLESMFIPSIDDKSTATIYYYKNNVRRINTLIGSMKMHELNPYFIERGLKSVESSGTKLKIYKTLSAAFNKAVKWKMIEYNPMKSIERPRIQRKRQETYSPEECIKLQKIFRGSELEPGIILGLFCGPRPEEICALDWVDLDLTNIPGNLSITKAYTSVSGKSEMTRTKTDTSVRDTPIASQAVARLLEIRNSRKDLGPVMRLKSGSRMSVEQFSKRYKQTIGRYNSSAIEEDKIRYIPVKNLRHTCATIMLSQGVDIAVTSRYVGHASVSTTASFYLSPQQSAKSSAAASLGDILAPVIDIDTKAKHG